MTKPLAVIGYIGTNTNLTEATSLIATELAAMARVLERCGYEAKLAQHDYVPNPKRRNVAPKTGIERWDRQTPVDLVWLHQGPPNFFGGPDDDHCGQIGVMGEALQTAKKVYRLVVDNNESMRHNCVFGLRRNNACPGFLLAVDGIESAIKRKIWYEVGHPEARDIEAGIPFIRCNAVFAEQLLLTKELLGCSEEKEYDFCYVGTSRANKKKQEARLKSLEGFLDHPNSFYTGSLFKKRSTFNKCWTAMGNSKAHLIVREPSMGQLPLHRYMQALVCEAIPVVLNEPTAVEFIHNQDLQDMLRVSSYEEGAALVKRYDELRPLILEERDFWLRYSFSYLPPGANGGV